METNDFPQVLIDYMNFSESCNNGKLCRNSDNSVMVVSKRKLQGINHSYCTVSKRLQLFSKILHLLKSLEYNLNYGQFYKKTFTG